jgi:hypothetical protein
LAGGCDHLYLDTATILSTEIDTSSELATLITDEVGSGPIVFASSTVLTSPTIFGTPSAASATWSNLGAVTTIDINGGTVDGVTIGGSSAGAITGTTITANTGFMPDANDGAYLGQSGTAFSDLFLASGGVVNWNASDVTITHSANTLAFAGASSGYTFDDSITLSGTDNLILNGNYLSGDGEDEGIYVSSSGNIGIATTSPSQIFTIGSTTSSQFLVNATGTVLDGTWQGDVITSTYLDTATILSTEIDTSSELATLITDEVGSGPIVFASSTVLTSPTIFGTPSAASATWSNL